MRLLTSVSAPLCAAAPMLGAMEPVLRIIDEMLDTAVRLRLQDAARSGSEAMFERVLGHTLARYDDDLVREHVLGEALKAAAAAGHLGIIQCIRACPYSGRVDVRSITQAAARHGHLETLQWLLDEYATNEPTDRAHIQSIHQSAVGGKQLHVLLWLYQVGGHDASLLRGVGDVAALHGDLATIKWLHELNAPGCFTEKAIDNASGGGYVETVEFLVTNRQDGYSFLAVHNAVLGDHDAILELLRPQGLTPDLVTTKFVIRAARLGRLDVLQLDLEPFTRKQPWEYPKSCSVSGMEPAFLREALRVACGHGHLHIVQWLVQSRGFQCDEPHVREAVVHGQVDILQWIHDHNCGHWGRTRDEYSSWDAPNLMAVAAWSGQLNVLKWLHQRRSEGCSSTALAQAASNGHVEVVKWLHENVKDVRFDVASIDEAALRGHLGVVQWLHENQAASCTTDAIDGAAQYGHLRVVEWLHFNRSEGCTTRAMDDAARQGEIQVIFWLHKNRIEGCTSEAAVGAARRGHSCVLDWLRRHYPEQFNESRVAAAMATASRGR